MTTIAALILAAVTSVVAAGLAVLLVLVARAARRARADARCQAAAADRWRARAIHNADVADEWCRRAHAHRAALLRVRGYSREEAVLDAWLTPDAYALYRHLEGR